MTWHPVCKESDIAVDDMKAFSVDGLDITVYRLEDGWYATSDLCTHADCSLAEGDMEGAEIVCWCHGGAFDIRTGAATRMPCAIPVETFAVRVREGQIEVEVD